MKSPKGEPSEVSELLTDLIIIQLGLARVPQQSIRKILGCDIVRAGEAGDYVAQAIEGLPH